MGFTGCWSLDLSKQLVLTVLIRVAPWLVIRRLLIQWHETGASAAISPLLLRHVPQLLAR